MDDRRTTEAHLSYKLTSEPSAQVSLKGKMGQGRVLSIDFFRLSPQCGGSAGAMISTLQWTKYGTRTISLSRKCKLDGRKVRLCNSPRMCGGEVTNDWCIFWLGRAMPVIPSLKDRGK